MTSLLNSPTPTSQIIRATDMVHVLREKIALLPGARDNNDRPVIIFPSRETMHTPSFDNIRNILIYLHTVTASASKKNKYVFIIDMRRGMKFENVKLILKTADDYFPGQIFCVLIIKPESFWEKQKTSIATSKYKFDVNMISAESLTKYVDVSNLTTDLGGLLRYDNEEWIETRLEIERIFWEICNINQRFEHFKLTMQTTDYALDVEGADLAIKQHAGYLELIKEQKIDVLDKDICSLKCRVSGGSSNSPDEGYSSGVSISSRNPDLINVFPHMTKAIDSLRGSKNEVLRIFDDKKISLDHWYQLKLFEYDAEKLFEWIQDHYNLVTNQLCDIGDSEENARHLLNDHNVFKKASEQTFVNVSHILEIAKRLKEQDNKGKKRIHNLAINLEKDWRQFQSRIDHRLELLQLSNSFQQKAAIYLNKYAEWKVKIEVDPASLITIHPDDLEATVKEYENFGEVINLAYAEAASDGRSLFPKIKLVASSNPEAFTKASENIDGLNKRIARYHKELMTTFNTRKDKLYARLAQVGFKRDVDLVLEWIDAHGEPYLQKNREIGENLARAKELESKHAYLRDVASTTFTNSQKLIKASQTLIDQGECNEKETTAIINDLKHRLNDFSTKLSARTVLLNHSKLFHTHYIEIIRWYNLQDGKIKEYNIIDTDVEVSKDRKEKWASETDATQEAYATTVNDGLQLNQSLVNQSKLLNFDNTETIQSVKKLIGEIEKRHQIFTEKLDRQRMCLLIGLHVSVLLYECTLIINQLGAWKKDMLSLILCSMDRADSIMPFHRENTIKVQEAIKAVNKSAEDLLNIFNARNLDMVTTDGRSVRIVVDETIGKVNALQDEVMETCCELDNRLENAIKLNKVTSEAHQVTVLLQREETNLLRSNRIPKNFAEADEALALHSNYTQQFKKNIQNPTLMVQQRINCLRQNSPTPGALQLLDEITMKLNQKYSHLTYLIDERVKLLKAAVTCHKSIDAVRPLLNQMESEHNRDELDFCSTKPDQKRNDLAQVIESMINKQENFKERFLTGSTFAQKNSESFLKYIRKCGAPVDHTSEHESRIYKIKEELREKQIKILEKLTSKKKKYEQCHSAVLIEASEQKISQWLQDIGETFMAKLPTTAAIQNGSQSRLQLEDLKCKLIEFKPALKAEKTDVVKFLKAAEKYLNNRCNDIHVATTKRAMDKVKDNFNFLSTRILDIEAQVMHALGNQKEDEIKNEFSLDRISDSSLDEKLSKRSATSIEFNAKLMQPMKELLQSERDYVADLLCCVNVYMTGYRNMAKTLPIPISGKEVEIFGNLEELAKFHSEIFLKDLERYEEQPEEVGNSFITWVDKLNELYTQYCINKEQNNHVIGLPECIQFFNELRVKNDLGHNKDLQSMVIKPIQRITRYRLMLDQLMKNAKLNVKEIKEAHDIVVDVPRRANDMIHLKRLDGYATLDVTMGEFIMQEPFVVSDNKHLFKKARERQVFLFEFCIIFTKKIELGPKDYKYVIKEKLILSDVSIREHVEGDICKFSLRMGTLPTSDMSIDLKAKNETSKMTWIKKIRDLMQNLLPYNIDLGSISISSDSKRSSRTSTQSKELNETVQTLASDVTSNMFLFKNISGQLQLPKLGEFAITGAKANDTTKAA
uniref:CRAL-TRIO domain-containing protein n=1 Tax=Rhabditophanes sp. KR3021 TaxID=114890 RepID=A0AC35TLP5_9BILA